VFYKNQPLIYKDFIKIVQIILIFYSDQNLFGRDSLDTLNCGNFQMPGERQNQNLFNNCREKSVSGIIKNQKDYPITTSTVSIDKIIILSS